MHGNAEASVVELGGNKGVAVVGLPSTPSFITSSLANDVFNSLRLENPRVIWASVGASSDYKTVILCTFEYGYAPTADDVKNILEVCEEWLGADQGRHADD